MDVAGPVSVSLVEQLVAVGQRVVDVQPRWPPECGCWARENQQERRQRRPVGRGRRAAIAGRPPGDRRGPHRGTEGVIQALPGREGRTQVACRFHAVLCNLVPGGFGKEITAGLLQRCRRHQGGQARRRGATVTPAT
jgi:hypothetical protein